MTHQAMLGTTTSMLQMGAIAAQRAPRRSSDAQHSGGQHGPTARDVMITKPDRVSTTDSLDEVARRMRELLVAFLPVCDEHDELRGIITLADVRPTIGGGGHPASLTAAERAKDPTVSARVNDPIENLPRLMAEHRVWLLPVLDGRRLVGVIRYRPRLRPVRGPG